MKKIYLCGPTVYNYPHIGNLRPAMAFDIFIRAQRHLGEKIFFLQNITDIDDKIIQKAIEEKKSELEISQFYEKYYLQQYQNFNLISPDKWIRVTDSLQQMYDYIQRLIDVGAAYQVKQNVFFDVMKFKDIYGAISNQKIDSLISNENNDYGKKNPLDFALWKETNIGVKYHSIFGDGRPGWHTECSCFIDAIFGSESIDIHGGGIDLIFPHHENENIQHYALHQKPIAKQWLHFGTLNYKNQKMSKSLGNIIYPHDFLKSYDADTYRILILTTNYSKPINITDELLNSNQMQINKFKIIANKMQLENISLEYDNELVKKIINLFANLNFANGYSEWIKLTKKESDYGGFIKIATLLGFSFPALKLSDENKKLYLTWKDATKAKDYQRADAIRAKLKEKGII
ncbi:cysteine--tRNA ligase [Mycoplasma phocoeninasale]|uniref:Cysteine--tRNA ligase n=1 Tax=Mycoplasma phocoeninasale TaxID=2726117 RepID=A0A858U2R9_9MOLU|nr:class I tRNA ligase family protein [Mycoplasma phocoeninasale]QJG66251.1 cysteine--tRNA ligase [Mycoplasma phocoeninasale]